MDFSMKYLELLAEQYPSINSASTEIINLQAILNLPKGTEHFLSDIHGEYLAFNHVLRNASGVIKNYIEELFGNALMESEKKNLAILIYYPEQKLDLIKKKISHMEDWYKITLFRLVTICKRVSSKYTRSKVRKALDKDFAYIIEELIHEDCMGTHKQGYYAEIIDSIIRLNRAPDFIIAISNVIRHLAIDHLHIIGDIFDRGRAPDKVMDVLLSYHSVDVQWGNHDINWIGAASGSEACICNVLRISARYNNLHIIEESYGINLIPLATFAMATYRSCGKQFRPELATSEAVSEASDSVSEGEVVWDSEIDLVTKMHKAITVIQLKLEAQIIKRNDFDMDDRLLLQTLKLKKDNDQTQASVTIEGREYLLNDHDFPTIDEQDPFKLSEEEAQLIEKIRFSFLNSSKLQEHVRFLLNKGSMYRVYNQNLLYHGCIPVNPDGSFKAVTIKGKAYSGKALLDQAEVLVRQGYFSASGSKEKQEGLDYQWYLWCGPDSPLYGKNRMATFERYFIDDKSTWEEAKDPYYSLRENIQMCMNILKDFGLNPETARIINGHVPVNVLKGENPVKAGGKMLVIDGGFTKAYQSVTGFAGYTLIYNSQGLLLASHEPFTSMRETIENEADIVSNINYIEYKKERERVGKTDVGLRIKAKIKDLEALVQAYSKGEIKENFNNIFS